MIYNLKNFQYIKDGYILNLGIEAGNYLVRSIENDDGVNYLTYLSENEEEVLGSIKDYLEMKKKINYDELSDEDKDVIIGEIEYALAEKYIIETKFEIKGVVEKSDIVGAIFGQR